MICRGFRGVSGFLLAVLVLFSAPRVVSAGGLISNMRPSTPVTAGVHAPTAVPCELDDSAIAPCVGAATTVPGATGSHSFDIYNNGLQPRTYSFGAVRYGAVAEAWSSVTDITVPANSFVTVTLFWRAGTTEGTGQALILANELASPNLLVGEVDVRVAEPLQLDIGMTNNDFQAAGLCAVSCFAVTHAQSTTPFFTLDSPRSLTLVYNGDRAFPRPFVYADVSAPDPARPVARYSLEVLVDGSPVTFVNGDAMLHFAGSDSTVRLVGQFDARKFATGVRPMTVVVTVTHTDNSTTRKEANTSLMTLDYRGSPVANGWSIAGVQRLDFPAGGGYMVFDGDGSAVQFSALDSLAADFTLLTFDGASYVRTYPDSTTVVFSPAGEMIRVTDPDGRSSTFSYDADGRLVAVSDFMRSLGATVPYLLLGYDSNGLSYVREQGGTGPMRTTSISVALDRTLTGITDPDGHSTIFSYDGFGRLSAVTDRRGSRTDYGYDALTWKLISVTLPEVPVDAGGGATTNTRPVVTLQPWQSVGLPRTATTPAAPAIPVAPKDVSAAVTDPVGRRVSFTPNAWGQPVRSTDVLGRVTSIKRVGFLPVQINSPTGAVDTVAYDDRGRVIMSKPSGQGETFIRYAGPRNQVDSVWGPGTRAHGLSYNTDGQVNSITFQDNPLTSILVSYDARTKRVASVTDELGHQASFSYDSTFGHLRKTIRPGARADSAVFDAHGRAWRRGATGMATDSIRYDVVNRVTHGWDGVHTAPVVAGYDPLFQASITDPKNNAYSTEFTALGQPKTWCDPLGACESFRYDASGLLKSYTNRRGQRVDMTHDSAGRLTSTSGMNTTTDSLSYSQDGRVFAAWNVYSRDSVFVNFGNAGLPQTDSTVTWIGGRRFRVFNTHSRDVAGTDTVRIASNYGVNFLERRATYSAAGFLESFFDGVNTTTYGYNEEGLRNTTTAPYGSRSESYTTIHAPQQASFGNSAMSSAFYRGYRYDVVGRLEMVLTGIHSGTRWTHTYDPLGRLTARETGGDCSINGGNPDFGLGSWCNVTVGADSFSYDATGNRTDGSAVIGAGNRISSFNGLTFTYDADGNITRKAGTETRDYYWSATGQLDSVVHNGWSKVRYDYNALGQPVRKWRGDPNGMYIENLLLWDGDQLLLDLDSLGNRIGEYVYHPGTIDSPFGVITGLTSPADIRYYQQDQLGNVIGYSADSTVTMKVSYDSWGVRNVELPDYNRLNWKGLWWEGDVVSLYYMRNRWYDPETGRFMSEDPIGHAGGINLYAFAGDDPINGIDPSGLACKRLEGHQTSYSVDMEVFIIWHPGDWVCPVSSRGGGGDSNGGSGEGGGSSGVGGGGRGTGSSNVSGDANRRIRKVPGCAAEHLGFNTILAVGGAGAVYAGKAIVPKPFKTSGTRGGRSSTATSRASTFFRRWVTADLPFRVRAPTWERPLASTKHLGTVLGRYTPIVGWGMLGASAYLIGSCVSDAS